MEILKCNADFSKIYYVEINRNLHQCKLLRTESGEIPSYVLDVAQIGIVKIKARSSECFNGWYYRGEIPSILYNSVEDYRNNKPIMDNYGSTGNCYNSSFIMPLFKCCSTCNCGGSVYAWKWEGCKAVKRIINTSGVNWYWDADGFHCNLNDMQDCYRTEEECIKNNEVMVVNF